MIVTIQRRCTDVYIQTHLRDARDVCIFVVGLHTKREKQKLLTHIWVHKQGQDVSHKYYIGVELHEAKKRN